MKNWKCFLIVASLVLCSEISTAQEELDGHRLQYRNPGMQVDLAVGLWASPIPVDYDEDGDPDLVVSCTDTPFKGTYFFENPGKDPFGMPLFKAPVRIGSGIRNVTVCYVNGEARILREGAEYVDFLKNVYDSPSGLTNAGLVLSMYPKKRFNQWKYVDYENDGDQDLIVGIDDWSEYGWDNAFNEKGEWTNGNLHGYVYLLRNEDGIYRVEGKIRAGGKPVDVYGNSTPNMEDFDGDGDLDLICGEFVDGFTWFENTGSRENPVFAAGRPLENENGIIRMDLEMMMPVAADWNRDGKPDLIVGDEDGRVAWIENSGVVRNGMPVFKDPVYFKQEAGAVKFGALVTPYSVDWDDDGDEDLICGNSAGYIGFIENLGGDEFPRWNKPEYLKADGKVIRVMAGNNGSIQGPCERKWGYTTLSVADWDGDGLKDILVNSIFGKVEWYRNTGKKGKPELESRGGVKVDWNGKKTVPKPSWNWWNPGKEELVTQWRTTPYAIDWNKDGLIDLVMLDHEGYLAFYERFNKNGELFLHAGKRIFQQINEKGERVPLRLNEKRAGGSGRRKICFTDWDLDGDQDILVNSSSVALYENVGNEKGYTVFKSRGDLVKTRLAGHSTSPTVVDWNRDGKPDLLIGAEDGHLYYYPDNH